MAAGMKIDRLLSRAEERYGFTHQEDLVAFATHGMSLGEHFDENPSFVRLLERLKAEGGNYADAATSVLGKAR